MDSRLVFNNIADEYDKWRPTYVSELYADIMSYSGINEASRVLENVGVCKKNHKRSFTCG